MTTPERRKSLPEEIERYMKHIDDRLDAKFDQMEKRFEAKVDQLFQTAFPGGDARGHREAHERDINAAKTWKDIGQDVTKKVTSGIVWAAVLGVFYFVTSWWKEHVK